MSKNKSTVDIAEQYDQITNNSPNNSTPNINLDSLVDKPLNSETSTTPIAPPAQPIPTPIPQPSTDQLNAINTVNNQTVSEEYQRFLAWKDMENKLQAQKKHEEKLGSDPEYFADHYLMDLEEEFGKEEIETFKESTKELIKTAQLTKDQTEALLQAQAAKARAMRDENVFRKEAEISHFEKHVRTTYGEVMGKNVLTAFSRYMQLNGIDPNLFEIGMSYQHKVQSLKNFYENKYLAGPLNTKSWAEENNKLMQEEQDPLKLIDFSSLKKNLSNTKN